MSKRKIALALSGGIDSAVAGLLLKLRGFNVVGIFMQNWDKNDEESACSSHSDIEDAQWVCHQLNIPFRDANFIKEYWNHVFSYLLDEYQSGLTPNPDIFCNKYIKFDAFFKYAFKFENVDAIATGHYARSSYGDLLENSNLKKGVKLLQAVDCHKDQTFFLSQISQESLKKTMFPLGSLRKEEVRAIGRANGLQRIVNKRESAGICFIGKKKFPDLISKYLIDNPGKFLDIESHDHVGDHKGFHQWTLGQKSNITGFQEKYYICAKDFSTNIIYVAKGNNHPALYTSSVYVEPFHWIHRPPDDFQLKRQITCHIRFQHRHKLGFGTVRQLPADDGMCVIDIDKPQRALTPGQFAVLYDGEECLGSARITHLGPTLFELGKPVAHLEDSSCYIFKAN